VGLLGRDAVVDVLGEEVGVGLGPAIDDLLHVGTLDGQGRLAFSLVLAFEV
jgi:hypothetical protein